MASSQNVGLAKNTGAAQRVATLTVRSANRKLTAAPDLRAISVTRAAQQSCPACPFFGNGCYAEGGPAGIHTSRVNKAAEAAEATPDAIALAEAAAIRANWPRDGRPLRLHEVGDCKTVAAAQAVGAAVAEVQSQGGGPAWTFTHAWADVARSNWGPVSVLASLERPEQAPQAIAQGYPLSAVVPSFSEGVKTWKAAGFRPVPCPQSTGAAEDCASCLLCTRSESLKRGLVVILFAPHGSRSKLVREAVK
jgi:hypothetical protein